MLTSQDRELISNYIELYGSVLGDSTPFMNNEIPYLDEWKKAKSEYLFSMFSNNLILEKEITVEASAEQIYKIHRTEFNDNRIVKFYDKIYHALYISNPPHIIYEIIDPRSLIKNKWTLENCKITLPDGKLFQIKTGMRVTKILQTLSQAYEIPDWELLRETHAKVMSMNKVKGTLCLSIHPMDYLTMSDNSEGWSTCTSVASEGSYRSGVIEMMNSPCVVVAYIKNNSKTYFNNWNSKIWRELYIVTPELITNIKAYPFSNIQITEKVLIWLKTLAKKVNFRYSLNLSPLEDIPVRLVTDFMYNDCYRSKQLCYHNSSLINALPMRIINYSGKKTCIACGKYELRDTETIVCDCCEEPHRMYCDYCGDEITDENYLFDEDGNLLCRYCFYERKDE